MRAVLLTLLLFLPWLACAPPADAGVVAGRRWRGGHPDEMGAEAMTSPVQGGAALPVVAVTDRPVLAGPALPVAVVTDGRAVKGGPAQAVYVVTSGPVQGGPAIPMVAAPSGAVVQGGPAIRVFIVSGSFAPAIITNGLIGWYRADTLAALADGDTVATWADQSGNGADLTQPTAGSRPTKQTVGGLPVVRSAAAKYLSNAGLSLNSRACSIFVVAAPSSAASAQKVIGVGGANTLILNQFSGEWGGQSLIGVNDLWLSGLQVSNNAFYVTGLRTDANGAMTVYRSGVESYRLQGHNADTVASATLTGLYVGTYSGLSNYFTGDIKEIAIYNRALTDAEARQVVAYLAAQHSLAPVAGGKQVIFDGNSLTVGYVAFPGMTDAALPQIPSLWRGYNFGASGQTIEQMAADAATQIDPLYNAAASKNVLVAWEGTNALQTLQNPTTVYNDTVSYCQARRAAGWQVVIATILPRTAAGTYANFEADRQTVNTNIRTNYAAFADALADVGNDATIGVTGASNNVTYYSDKTHLTTAGYAIVATYMKNAVNAL